MDDLDVVVNCDLATVIIRDEEGGDTAEMVVPAFTRDELDFTQTINMHHNNYVLASRVDNGGHSMSVADFAMYLLTQAAFEPRQQ